MQELATFEFDSAEDSDDADVYVVETFTNHYGDERAVLDGDTYNAKESIKFDWNQTHHKFDRDGRKAWIVDADSLDALAEQLEADGFTFDADGDAGEQFDETLAEFGALAEDGDFVTVEYAKKNGNGTATKTGVVYNTAETAVYFENDENGRTLSIKGDRDGVTSLFSSGYAPYMGSVVSVTVERDEADDADDDADVEVEAEPVESDDDADDEGSLAVAQARERRNDLSDELRDEIGSNNHERTQWLQARYSEACDELEWAERNADHLADDEHWYVETRGNVERECPACDYVGSDSHPRRDRPTFHATLRNLCPRAECGAELRKLVPAE